MTPCHIQKVLVILIVIHLQKGEDSIEDNNNDKFNVAIFLAKTSTSQTYRQDAGIKFLNFVQKTRVKHSAATGADDGSSSFTGTGSDCKQLLKGGIYSLISYCRTVMGMTTAIASIENDTFSNGLRFKKSPSEDLEIRYHYPRNLGRFNQIRGQERFITEPEHTEVFKIRSKRQSPIDEIPDIKIPDDIPPNWDIFGIMANIKLTFFGKFFENNRNMGKVAPEPPQKELVNQLGKVSENSVFELVRETLANVQDGQECGFLMIILGGYLKEICDIYSGLMQSVKHVVENTDEKNTLIVVTGSCPIVESTTGQDKEFLIPVYIKGPPRTRDISISGQLYDVPYAIKNFLTEINGGNYFPAIRTKRKKRSSPVIKEKRNKDTTRFASPQLILIMSFILTFTL